VVVQLTRKAAVAAAQVVFSLALSQLRRVLLIRLPLVAAQQVLQAQGPKEVLLYFLLLRPQVAVAVAVTMMQQVPLVVLVAAALAV